MRIEAIGCEPLQLRRVHLENSRSLDVYRANGGYEAIKKVQAAGGKVVTPKTPIPGMGAYGRVSDTEGNVLGLFEAAG